MKYSFKVSEISPFKRRRIRKSLTQILEQEGFKRNPIDWRHPFTKQYSLRDVAAKIFPTTEEHGFEPYVYKAIGLEIEGPGEDPVFRKIEEKIYQYKRLRESRE